MLPASSAPFCSPACLGTTGYAANAYQTGAMIPQVLYTRYSGGIFNAVLVPQIVRTLKLTDARNQAQQAHHPIHHLAAGRDAAHDAVHTAAHHTV